MGSEKYTKHLKGWRRWLYLGAGALLMIFTVIFATAYTDNRDNIVVVMGFILCAPAGVFMLYRGIRKPDTAAVITGIEKPVDKVNSLNVYAAPDLTGKMHPVKVAFEWVDAPLGQPQQCLNNNRWYHVHIFDVKNDTLVPFSLPDNQYFDPREFANVIKMPAHMNLFEKHASMLQKVGPWVMVVAFLISIFGMITTAPTGG